MRKDAFALSGKNEGATGFDGAQEDLKEQAGESLYSPVKLRTKQ